MITGAAVRAAADNAGNARTSDENNDTSRPHAEFKANFLDIGKTPYAFPSVLIRCTVLQLGGFRSRRLNLNHTGWINMKTGSPDVTLHGISLYLPCKFGAEVGPTHLVLKHPA